mmetsp:Transcript_3184/g.3794  ORF Transcript_3184/g.3794 Transcript_3184/m.3794 type:complete len:359 (-) Transcript_3184:13-1089(-)
MKLEIVLGLIVSTIYMLIIRRMSSKSVNSISNEINNAASEVAHAAMQKNPHPFPTYFVSHGGPTFMYEEDAFGNKGAWNLIKKLGTQIKKEWKPDYIIVVSAHWQSSGRKLVEVGIPETGKENPLIYDFYGFPDHMYKEEFHTNNNLSVAQKIKEELEKGGFHSDLTKRGIDHGVWVPLKVAFLDYNTLSKEQPVRKDLDLPETSLIQVSLTGDEKDFDSHHKLGKILSKFRENLIWDESQQKYLKGMVICSGMSVHNLRDLSSFRIPGKVMPYTQLFNDLLTKSITNTNKAFENLKDLQTNYSKLLYLAHPTLEHFVPIVVASGIVDGKEEPISELYNDNVASLGWGIYQFGNNYSA